MDPVFFFNPLAQIQANQARAEAENLRGEVAGLQKELALLRAEQAEAAARAEDDRFIQLWKSEFQHRGMTPVEADRSARKKLEKEKRYVVRVQHTGSRKRINPKEKERLKQRKDEVAQSKAAADLRKRLDEYKAQQKAKRIQERNLKVQAMPAFKRRLLKARWLIISALSISGIVVLGFVISAISNIDSCAGQIPAAERLTGTTWSGYTKAIPVKSKSGAWTDWKYESISMAFESDCTVKYTNGAMVKTVSNSFSDYEPEFKTIATSKGPGETLSWSQGNDGVQVSAVTGNGKVIATLNAVPNKGVITFVQPQNEDGAFWNKRNSSVELKKIPE